MSGNGSHAIRFAGSRVYIRTDRDMRGNRPWVNRPPLPSRRVRLARGGALAELRP